MKCHTFFYLLSGRRSLFWARSWIRSKRLLMLPPTQKVICISLLTYQLQKDRTIDILNHSFSKILILLWFYEKLDQFWNRQKSYFLQNGCHHCLWLGSYILPFQSSTSCLRNKLFSFDIIFYSSYNNNPSIIFIFFFFFIVWGKPSIQI